MYNNRLVSWLAIIVVVVGLGWYLSSRGILFNKPAQNTPSDWHAVFLSNGQVYFGKLTNESKQYATLQDIFYLQLAQSPQPESQKTKEQPQISLVKLGNELHGPVDEMQINRDHILFIEKMKSDAKVVQSIERYKKEGPTPASVSPSP